MYFVFTTKLKYRCNRSGDPHTLFDVNSANSSKLYIFKNYTDLGAIYQTIDWASLVELLPEKRTMVGAPSWLPKQGYFGLMFLKHYLKLSDEKLLERFNTERSAAAVGNPIILWDIID